MNAQFKKGALELCVLAMLLDDDKYGYELTDEISKNLEIAPGTLYLVLKRLKDDDLVTTYLKESDNGPARKYYHLSDEGRTYTNELKNEWIAFVKAVDGIINN
ncbi:MAG: PadR family transcriptional regulator [Lachnospiraceae bacterium]|nr:PadR family transcriptional regulator [Lachnospiraceae bacterium]MBQ3891037.1 PadR family transcriptional regulator [Lachnospiraceae bacterium]MBQ9863233.1 PadR family transcriptional regulator [Lachnospiraceae bacterium]